MESCKIISIKKLKLDHKIPVYDIEVSSNNHNFILKNGLVVHNCKPYQYFKTTIYENRLELYDSKVLLDEIIDLERNINTGKVDHPNGGRKDVCDAVCGAIYNASKHADEFAFDYGESLDTLANFNDINDIEDTFEEALKGQYKINSDDSYMDFGVGKSEVFDIGIFDGIMNW